MALRDSRIKVLGLLAATILGHGQQSSESGIVYGTHSRLVVCHTTVIDRNGYLMTDLNRSAFAVFENDAPQTLKVFEREDVPVSLGILIDNSRSMLEKKSKVTAAALNLAKASNPGDEVFVVNFNEKAYLDLPNGKNFTSDIHEMQAALSLTNADGGTAMRDAVRMSIDHLQKNAHRDKKVLVVLTDGEDNSSKIGFDDLVRAAQQSDVLIYSIGLLDVEGASNGSLAGSARPEAIDARRNLKDLAAATGGESFFPTALSEVDQIAWRVARDIRNQYVIAYTSTNQAMDSTFRKIRISVNAPRRPVVHTRAGYYATPD